MLHAKLGPSSAHRWINCPGSLRMAELVPEEEKDEGSVFATEGTIAHSLAEIYARAAVQQAEVIDFSKWYTEEFFPEYGEDRARLEEMKGHAEGYADFVMERYEMIGATQAYFEIRLNCGVEGVWGTTDCILIADNIIEVIDYKYGSGVPVSAEKNPQLLLYGVGALDRYGDLIDTTETIVVSVYQPRVFDGVSTYSVTAPWLRFWRDEVVAPAAREAMSGHGHLAPSASNCKWCPAAGFCKARAAMELRHDFDVEPELMTAQDLADLYPRLADIEKWTKQAKAAALVTAEFEGLPGYTIRQKRGSRKITNPDEAIDRLQGAGFDFDSIATVSPLGITALRGIVGPGLDDILGDTVEFKGGGPALAKEEA